MVTYRHEPAVSSATASRIGLLLCNLGTPDAATGAALRPYLAQFLSDPRVIELPRLLWQPLLHGVILRKRPAESARKYASIWMPEGSPLAVWSERLRLALTTELERRGIALPIRVAMRYGAPSIAAQMDHLKAEGCQRIVVLPLYPQYAGATVGSVFDDVADWMRHTRVVPALRTVQEFHDHPGYIAALAESAREHWAENGPPAHLIMSFHGLPQAMIDRGDPYRAQCAATAGLLAQTLDLKPDAWTLAFQSRFGRAQWITPSTQDKLQELGRAKIPSLAVICPGFSSDCLETLEEIGIEGRGLFQEAGGGRYDYIPCLNTRPAWVRTLADVAVQQMQGWL